MGECPALSSRRGTADGDHTGPCLEPDESQYGADSWRESATRCALVAPRRGSDRDHRVAPHRKAQVPAARPNEGEHALLDVRVRQLVLVDVQLATGRGTGA